MDVLAGIVTWFILKVIDVLPGKFVDGIFGLFKIKREKTSPAPVAITLYPPDCGDRAVNLGYRKPYVAEYFGGYFAGLLEDTYGYLRIDEQVDCPATPETARLAPVARILYELRKPTGPRLVVIAAAGGMGKTTLAAKIVKCLYEQKDADFILGDSAKAEHIDPATGKVVKLDPSFHDPHSFYRRLYAQVGLPTPPVNISTQRMIDEINEQLSDFRAVIVVDNLDTVRDTSALLSTLQPLLGREVRAIVTTREIKRIDHPSQMALAVNLRPITDLDNARAFLRWHIAHYKQTRPGLAEVEKGLDNKSHVENLIRKTGGVPLIMQLVLNDIENKSWSYIEHLPTIPLSSELLDYLYKQRWDELTRLRMVGETACKAVEFIVAQQRRGKRVAFADLDKWAHKEGRFDSLTAALGELENRFLILNRDTEKGNFSVFPSLADFIQRELPRT